MVVWLFQVVSSVRFPISDRETAVASVQSEHFEKIFSLLQIATAREKNVGKTDDDSGWKTDE